MFDRLSLSLLGGALLCAACLEVDPSWHNPDGSSDELRPDASVGKDAGAGGDPRPRTPRVVAAAVVGAAAVAVAAAVVAAAEARTVRPPEEGEVPRTLVAGPTASG